MTIFVYVLLCIIWGTTWIAIKIGLTDAPPLWAASLRFWIAVTALVFISTIRGYRWPTDRRTLVRLAYPGLFLYGGHYVLIYFAQLHIDSSLNAVLFAAFPLFVALLSTVRLPDERLSALGWLGLVIGLGGVIIISLESLSLSGNMFLGTMLGLAGALSAAYGIVIHRKHFVSENIVVSVTVQMFAGGIPLTIAALLLEDISQLNLTVESVGSVLYLGLPGTVITFLGYYYLLRKIPTVTLSLMAFITPVVAIIVGVVFFGEHLTLQMSVGTVLILSSVLLVVRKATRQPEPTAAARPESSQT